MKNNNSTGFSGSTVLFTGLGIVLLTAAFYWLMYPAEPTRVDQMAIWFLLFAECAFTAGIYVTISRGIAGSPLISRIGVPMVLFLYLVATFIMTVTKGTFQDHPNGFIFTHLIIMVPTAVICVVINAFSNRIGALDKATAAATQFMFDTERKLAGLVSQYPAPEYAAGLNAVYEAAKYADRVGSTSKDADIFAGCEALEKLLATPDVASADVETAISKLKFLFQQRGAELAQTKRGGF